MSPDYTVRLDRVFQGPMDLLLHLVREQEVEIHDVQISLVLEAYMAYLKSLEELDIEYAGEFLVMGAEESFGTRPRRGSIEEIHEDGISVAFENLENVEIDVACPTGANVKLSFRIPLYHPTHVFKVEAAITGHEQIGRETVILRTEFTEITDAERAAVVQYVKDLRFLNEEN